MFMAVAGDRAAGDQQQQGSSAICLFVVLMVVQIALPPLHLEHNLYNLAGAPATPHSDMNGYGHFITGWAWFNAYWALFAAILVILASAFWVRGVAPALARRLRQARQQSARRADGAADAVLAMRVRRLSAPGSTTTPICVNEYLPPTCSWIDRRTTRRLIASSKTSHSRSIVAVNANVDIYPAERRVEIRGRYKLVNSAPSPSPTCI